MKIGAIHSRYAGGNNGFRVAAAVEKDLPLGGGEELPLPRVGGEAAGVEDEGGVEREGEGVVGGHGANCEV